jgi:hypothetical protein
MIAQDDGDDGGGDDDFKGERGRGLKSSRPTRIGS